MKGICGKGNCNSKEVDQTKWKKQNNGEHYLMTSFIICTLHLILLATLNQGTTYIMSHLCGTIKTAEHSQFRDEINIMEQNKACHETR
jgi:hypothetical protein